MLFCKNDIYFDDLSIFILSLKTICILSSPFALSPIIFNLYLPVFPEIVELSCLSFYSFLCSNIFTTSSNGVIITALNIPLSILESKSILISPCSSTSIIQMVSEP